MEICYIVKNAEGRVVLQAAAECRYPKNVELDLMDHGYTVHLNGRRLTKKEARGDG